MEARKLLYLFPAILCLIMVFGFSSQPYNQQSVIPFLQKHITEYRLAEILPNIHFRYGHTELWSKIAPYQFVEFVFRKCAHIFSYSALGCSLYYAFSAFGAAVWKPGLRIIAMMLGLLAVAALDEWNQIRVSMRTGQPIDVALDVIGGTLGALSALFVFGRVRARWRN
ncbi:VanZ family protein [Cohnella faecalis]|uniref:VanZ-like domain-containing protein n=1 Tax=Cohnella faecalis TaxID=2315694 RepID=A0A398CNJ7_9BACL|nr:VanZ family protein [Cohnella faecalis]RIE03810.1 hypothetical protein D3H35_09665 [Cohnella faecalis]